MITVLHTVILFASLKTIQGSSDISPSVANACRQIYDPEALATSCCLQTNQYVQRIAACRGSYSTLKTCSQVRCVTEKYGLLTNGEIDLKKARVVLVALNKIDSVTKYLNSLITKYCIEQDYRAFPSDIADCLPLKYVYCTFYAYRVGCGNVDCTATCKQIKKTVDTCKPFMDQYVQMLNKQYRG